MLSRSPLGGYATTDVVARLEVEVFAMPLALATTMVMKETKKNWMMVDNIFAVDCCLLAIWCYDEKQSRRDSAVIYADKL